MCGRFTLTGSDPGVLRQRFGLQEDPPLAPRYNIAPGQQVLTVRRREQSRRAELDLWGLVPHWADSPAVGYKLINARAESVAAKAAYRDAFRRSRCLIPADGFYEWAKTDSGKVPHWITLTDHGLFAFAGLRSAWRTPDEEWLPTCSIVTTTANSLVAPLHDRMPVILDPAAEELWLDPEADPADLQELLVPYDAVRMGEMAVSRAVNDADNEGPDLVLPAPPEPAQLELDPRSAQ